jgi:hypothetical protein
MVDVVLNLLPSEGDSISRNEKFLKMANEDFILNTPGQQFLVWFGSP